MCENCLLPGTMEGSRTGEWQRGGSGGWVGMADVTKMKVHPPSHVIDL